MYSQTTNSKYYKCNHNNDDYNDHVMILIQLFLLYVKRLRIWEKITSRSHQPRYSTATYFLETNKSEKQ